MIISIDAEKRWEKQKSTLTYDKKLLADKELAGTSLIW